MHRPACTPRGADGVASTPAVQSRGRDVLRAALQARTTPRASGASASSLPANRTEDDEGFRHVASVQASPAVAATNAPAPPQLAATTDVARAATAAEAGKVDADGTTKD